MRPLWKEILIIILEVIIYVMLFTMGDIYGTQKAEARYRDIGCYMKDGIVTIHDNSNEDLLMGGIVVERALDSREGA